MAMELDKDILTVFSAKVEQQTGDYIIRIPRTEIDHGPLSISDEIRVTISEARKRSAPTSPDTAQKSNKPSRPHSTRKNTSPPVSQGDQREVTVEDIGDEGDGIARLKNGFVLIVPDSDQGESLTVEVQTVMDSYAIATPV